MNPRAQTLRKASGSTWRTMFVYFYVLCMSLFTVYTFLLLLLLRVVTQEHKSRRDMHVTVDRSSQSRKPPDVINMLGASVPGVAAELETVSFRSDSTFISSNPTSLASYKTERSINSRKSRYNALPQRKYAGIGQFSQDLVSEDVDDASVPKNHSTFSGLLSTIPIVPKAEESRPNLDARPPETRGDSIYGLAIANMSSQLECKINDWARDVLRITPARAPALQEAVLTDLTDVGENTALFTDVRPMTARFLLRHALAKVISEGIINSLIVSNSIEANFQLTRVHERLLTRDLATAAVWRHHTFSVSVENLTPEMMRMVFEEHMPLLAALLPDIANDPFGTRGLLEDAFKFSCMLRDANADVDVLYRSFVPELASKLNTGLIELVKPCQRSERGEVDRVGATIFPGIVQISPTPPIAQTVVRRAQVICECELLETSNPV